MILRYIDLTNAVCHYISGQLAAKSKLLSGKMLNTVQIDEGSIITRKYYNCKTCLCVMHFIYRFQKIHQNKEVEKEIRASLCDYSHTTKQ